MIEILPIRVLTLEDSPIFGSLNVALGQLTRSGLPVAAGMVVTAPQFKLQTILGHYDFGHKEIFEQSLTLVKKEINSIPVPQILQKETKNPKHFFLDGTVIKSQKQLWQKLLEVWLQSIKNRLWQDGFYKGITEGLDPQIVIFVKKVAAFGSAYFDPLQDEVVINSKDKLHPNDLKKIDEVIRDGNRKLFIPHEYEWIIERGVKLTKVLPYTPLPVPLSQPIVLGSKGTPGIVAKTAIKVFLDLSIGLVVEKEVDGVYIASEKIFDLNKPQDSFENLLFKLVEAAITFPTSAVLFKLADKSEGMGQVRGALRLLHQSSLLDPMLEAADFVRHKKGLTNVHLVVPFVRTVNELLQIKRELAVKKLGRKNSLQLWLEVAVPENVVNLEEYLVAGLDGMVLNLDELISHLNGFDTTEAELMFYKKEVNGLLKFMEDGLKLLHKSKVPFITVGSLSLDPPVLEYLVEKGVYGVVVERYEAPSAHELLHQAERRMILRKTQQ